MKVFEYPTTVEKKVIDVIHGVEVEDNYKWLENLENDEVKKWIKSQNFFTDQQIPKNLVEKFSTELKDFIYHEREGPRKIRGSKEFYYTIGKDDELYAIKMKDLISKKEIILIDPHDWSEDHTDTVQGFYPSSNGNYLAHDKVLGGDEWASSLHILDIRTGKYIDGPIPNTRLAQVEWREEEGFFYTKYPEKNEVSETQAYTERNVFYHKLGTDSSEDKLIYRNEDPKVFTFIKSTLNGKDCLIFIQKGWSQTNVLLYRTDSDKLVSVCENLDGTFDGNIIENSFIGYTNYLTPNSKIIKIDLDKPDIENWTVLVPESDHALNHVEFYGKRMVVWYLENSYLEMYVYDLNGSKLNKIKLPTIGAAGFSQGDWDSSEFQYIFTSHLHPYTVLRTNLESFETEIVFEPKTPLDTEKYQTVQKWYQSKDGTKVPMFLVMKKDVELNSNNPVLLEGYGGFKASNTPYYYPRYAFLLKKGFILAFPSLRGGGDFGEKWHQEGMLGNKQNVFDDFITAAEWLIENKYTQRKLLTIEGGSNGGLLTGACVVQRPDLFGNVMIIVPVLDMIRFHKFYNAQPWMVEYGDPEKEEDFQFLYEYSPYHKADQNTEYPSIFLTTNLNDKRVHPMHAFKMTAKLQKIEKINPILLRTITKAGHGVVSREQHRIESAEIAAFIFWRSNLK